MHPKFKDVIESLIKLHTSKSADYGSDTDALGNIHSAEKLGLSPFIGVALRLQDKFSRLETFVRSGKLQNEGIADTLQDIAVCSIIGIICLDEERKKIDQKKKTQPVAVKSHRRQKPKIKLDNPSKLEPEKGNELTSFSPSCAKCLMPLKLSEAVKKKEDDGDTRYYCQRCAEKI